LPLRRLSLSQYLRCAVKSEIEKRESRAVRTLALLFPFDEENTILKFKKIVCGS
jgi:hypothetical protein